MMHRVLARSPVGTLAFLICCLVDSVVGNSRTCHADVLYLHDGNVLYGRITEQTRDSIQFDQRVVGSSQYQPKTIRRTDIVSMVQNIQPERLVALSPDNPSDYRDLAEELATQRRDPEARHLAIRLFLVAAKLDKPKIRAGCFASLLSLARSPEEEKRFRALGFVEANREDGVRNWLTKVGPANSETAATPFNVDDLKQLRKTMVLLRKGRRSEAAKLVGQEWFEAAIVPFQRICTAKQLREWSSKPELKLEWLARIMELEIAIERAEQSAAQSSPNSENWSELIDRSLSADQSAELPMSPIDYSNVSEFDLSLTLYRNGKWVKEQ